MKKIVTSLAILAFVQGVGSALAFAGESPVIIKIPDGISLEKMQKICTDMIIVNVDGHFQCQSKPFDSFDKIIEDMQSIDLQNDPIEAGNEGNRAALRHLPYVNQETNIENWNYTRGLLRRFESIDASNLTGEQKLNHDLLGFVLRQKVLLSGHDTGRLPFTNDTGFFNLMSYVSRQTQFKIAEDYEAYAARLSELPRFFKQHQANMQRGIETKFVASADILPSIINTVKIYANADVTRHAFFKPFTIFPDTINKNEQKRLKALGQKVIGEQVIPAYQNLLTFLETEYAPHARKTAGIGDSMQMREYYKDLVKYYTTLDITPDEVHEIGLSEVKRIRGEMNTVIKQTGFKGDFKKFLAFLRTDKQFYAKTPEDLLKEAAWIAKRIDGQMPRYFGRLPRLSYGIIKVPDEIAPNYTTGRYWSGNAAQGLAGNFVVNTYDLSQRPLYNLPALALHEGVPGHHHQISLAQEMQNVPKFRQSLYPNAFGEGWGLYAEKLGEEMGIYRTPYEKFGRLTYEMWRACRLVVDTGMHWKGWSRERAEACFLENSALSEHNIRTEVDRYISWPGQALSYKIGELKIVELRKKAAVELGPKFDIRKFHDAVLKNGGIPLNILEDQINMWIAEQKRVK
ncbi:MAG: DUF885 family protein [Robiginitomaculum sp.]